MARAGKAALYCRLSMDDGNDGESMSIQGQKALLSKYAQDNGIADFEFYVDDGYSGTNFNRPSFRRMITDIEGGKVTAVITKDLSRLGRNYLESGAYIEVFFPKHNVRYIAVNDGVDSINAAGLDITPFKNILNEFYSRDIAKKVKTGKQVRAKAGKYMATTAAFGYQKDAADKNHLVIDERTAPTVRRVYELALQGMGNNRIKNVLRAERLPRPAYYKREDFGHHFIGDEERYYDWSKHIISGMLRNPIYKGCLWVATHSKRFNSKNPKFCTQL
ncbi:MAG: recombinase family protein [Coriobacteriales bacterium]|jgi:DNA invertase Pin-like site-specific DNA recombinase|nr:recombinase family protein [Coriobacteriales bacterium]